MNIIINGINLADYRRFKKYVPYVQLLKKPETRELTYNFQEENENIKDAALFCYYFVIDSILLMKEHKFSPYFSLKKTGNVLFKVIKKCNILVRPFMDSEIIRETIVGENLNTFHQTDLEAIFYANKEGDFVEINQDSDRAYIKKDSIEILEKGK